MSVCVCVCVCVCSLESLLAICSVSKLKSYLMMECCQGEGAVPTNASISSAFLGEQALSTSLPLSVSRMLSSILMAIPLKLEWERGQRQCGLCNINSVSLLHFMCWSGFGGGQADEPLLHSLLGLGSEEV